MQCWLGLHQSHSKRHLKKRYQKPNYKNVTYIGIDEIYCGSKSGFMTVVIDMKTSAVIYTEKGKKAASLDGFWERKNRCKQPIVAVATDMGPAYISSVKKHAPQASLVIDRFHVVKRFNERLSQFRRKIQNEMESKDDAQFLKNTRWLLLRNPENLSEKGADKLKQALEANQPLATVYYFKEKLRQLWTQPTKELGEAWLDDWVEQAQDSEITLLQSFAKILIKHKQGILAYYDEKMTSGKVEGVNNRTKTLSKIAYGYRDWEFFELKIKASHEAKYSLTG
ncbi:ISL3 family transposase [Parashewanella spongiae]|uniref:ISL3 family transposase n=1 Tax=Parashewanella spongiae TaxID=342950 RepID=A0A3A6U3U9_9GAMM|nr:ISL3 family transposase [Parashewanella spongiae]RJY12220.1 ISL3 family transposase [Parashewanella spongiae]